jgi:hypothetical protein
MGELRGLEASRKGALTTPSVGGLLPERRITPDASLISALLLAHVILIQSHFRLFLARFWWLSVRIERERPTIFYEPFQSLSSRLRKSLCWH